MDMLKSIRDALGISQKDLARILGISLSLLKQVETGRRGLPSDARSMLAFMYDLVQNIDPQAKADVPPVSDSWKDRKLKLVRARLGTVELELEKWETKQKQAESRIKMVKVLRTGATRTTNISQTKWLDVLEYDSNLWLESDKQKPYWDLVLRMEGLQAILRRLETL